MEKVLILLFVLIISINFRKTQDGRSHEDTTPYNTQFLSNFDTMVIPFKVNSSLVLDYQDSIFNDKGELILNPLFRYLNGADLILLKTKFNTEESNFFSFSKHKAQNFFLLSLIEVNKTGMGWWLKLLTIENSGQIIDTLTFAGEKQGLYETQNCIIDKELNIETTLFYDIQQYISDRQDLYYATEINKKYSLLENGKFLLRNSDSRNVCFVFTPTQIAYRNIIIKCPE
jgi:hypothetical protein